MCDHPVIVSLTSIKRRYDSMMLHNTLDALTNLNYDNYIVVLNISKEPKFLDSGFTDSDITCLSELYPKIMINIVENYGSLRKIMPTLKLFKDHIIITVDDDCIYDKNIISTYVNVYNIHKCIVSSRCRDNFMNLSNFHVGDNILSDDDEFKINMMPEGIGGVLYHSSMFNSKFINFNFNTMEEEFLKNDDLLLRACTILQNIPVYCKFIYYEDKTPSVGLYSTFNSSYRIKFKKFINRVKFIVD
jgi:hypothetical protein